MEPIVLFVPYIASSTNTRQHWTARKRDVDAGVLPDDRGEYVRRVILEPPEVDRRAESGTWIEIRGAQTKAA